MALVFVVNLYFLAKNGQTLGKMILRIQIVRANHEPVGLGRADTDGPFCYWGQSVSLGRFTS